MNPDPIVILSARRTPVGAFQGVFAGVTAPQLGAVAIKAAIADSGLAAADVDEVMMGCVLSAGLGQAPARQAALGAGMPASAPCTTINKMCGSAMRAVMLAADQILAGSAEVIVAGGLESMTNAPYLLPKARAGYRMGHQEVLDHMFFDGLQSPWDGQLMGCFAEATSGKYDFSRQAQDEFATESVRRAKAAATNGGFRTEIVPVTAKSRKGDALVDTDETPSTLDVTKIPSLKPAFKKDGTVTAASSASISDGAAAVVLTRESIAARKGLKPLARILGYTSFAREPEWFTLAPVGAIRKLLTRLNLRASDIDLYEVNEAFAPVPLAWLAETGADPARLNPGGGAIAIGHPLGASGARLMTALVHHMTAEGIQYGLQTMCEGGGMANATVIERIA
jgi:acetyl-CoA C-acetyltransferase